MTDSRTRAKIARKKGLDARCKHCEKKFNSGGNGNSRWSKVCPDCYETVPYEGNYCCGRCKGKPYAFECSNRYCECGQHADMARSLSNAD